MAERPDRDSKTEQATEKKLRDEMERGNVPISREATIFAFMLALLLILSFFIRDGAFKTTYALGGLLDHASGIRLANGNDLVLLFETVLLALAPLFVPIFAVLMASGIAASISQNAPRLVFQRLMPDLSRISPTEGWHRIFGSRGRIEFLKNFAKFVGVTLVVMALLQSDRDIFTGSMFIEPEALPGLIVEIATKLVSGLAIATLLLVAGDLVWSRISWRQDLMMSREEVKEELKQLQGDPFMKSRMRSLALDRRRRSMIAAVAKATLVVANPTHYAIAIRYVREEGGAPKVLAKGQDIIALRIRQVAEEHDIPVVEDKALARSMYDSVEVDQMIPPEFYRAVAELIHYLHKHEPRRSRIN
ncbi:MAG TPA: EscU/YscU/HrcU family type III secretion system export apparatus switch protein [Methylovirgula sp.]|jgi:flagellar biosynthetic protein FlhB